MLGLWTANLVYNAEMFGIYYKERKKYNHFLSDFLEYFIMYRLFKRSVYAVT